MHGQHSVESQQQHMWSPPSQRSTVGNTADSDYRPFSKGGRTLNVGDCALFQAGNSLPFIGILRKVTLETVDKEQAKLSVNWLYRPADLKLGKGVPLESAPNEIFYSFHKDEISAATLLHPCKVAFLRKGVELPTGVSSFVCRRVYDTANKCLWWLTDQDYTNEHQEEVDQLLDRTKLEMQAAIQSGGPSPRVLSGPTTSQQLKLSGENVQSGSYCFAGKGKKRERSDQNLDPCKREQNVKLDDADASPLKRERSMKPEEILSNLDKDGGLLSSAGVERLVQLMQQDQNDGTRKVADVAARRTMLAGVIAGTEKEECLTLFLQLGGLRLLDEWLQEAHKGKVGDAGSPKEVDKGVEDLLLALLRALDRLPVDLEALKTCIVGKSVNHLRSHKNSEIQKKARKLVDVWKKRVDTEMKSSGELKSGAGHGISWTYKQSPNDLVSSLSMKGSGGASEVAVKSSGAFAGSAKAAPNGSSSGDANTKTLGMGMGGKVGSPTLPAPKENGLRTCGENGGPDFAGSSVKEEKSSSSSHSPSNGHSWGSGAGKSGSMTWKDDVKNAAVVSVHANCKNAGSGGGGGGLRLPNVQMKGVVGANLSVGSKEVGSGKSLVWSRNSTVERAGSPGGGVEKMNVEAGSSQQRLVVRIPNPGRSPARASGGTGEVPFSRSSSPPEVADPGEGKSRLQGGSPAHGSPGDVNVRIGSESKCGTSGSDEKTKLVEVDKVGIDTGNQRKGDSESEYMSKETSTFQTRPASNSAHLQKGLVDGCPRGEDSGNMELDSSNGAAVVEDGAGRQGQPSPMEVDEGAMGLLATVAAAAEECVRGSAPGGSIERGERGSGRDSREDNELAIRTSTEAGPAHDNLSAGQMGMDEPPEQRGHVEPIVLQSPGISSFGSLKEGKSEQKEQGEGSACLVDARQDGEEERASAGRGETNPNGCKDAGLNGELVSNLPIRTNVSDEQLTEGQQKREEVNTKLSSERSFPKEYKITGRNGLEGMLSGYEGHLNGRFGKRELGTEDRNLLRSHSKVGKSAIELCNGIGAGGGDYRSSIGAASLESRMHEERVGKKRGQDSVQVFGRRGDSDCQRLADLVSGFPEEDVLEVARQAANEVEQMEKYGKPISSSSVDRDEHESEPLGLANSYEPRDANVVDSSGRDHRRLSALHDAPKDSGSDGSDQHHFLKSFKGHVCDPKETATGRQGETTNLMKVFESGEGEEVDQASSAERRLASKTSHVNNQEPDLLSETGHKESRTVDNIGSLLKGSSFQQIPEEGSNVPSPIASQLVVKPTTPQQAAECSGPSDAAVGGSDASERPDFDLNEGFAAEDSAQDDAATPVPASMTPIVTPVYPLASAASACGLAAPIAVLAATKGAFIPPASPIRLKGELGWKGSAATSAFRPAEPRRTPERQNSNAESIASDVNLAIITSGPKRSQPFLEFDLNVADERVMEDAGVAATTLSSQGSVLGMSLHNHSLPSSSVSGVTFIKQENPSLTFLKPESSSSAHPLSNGGSGPARTSHGTLSSRGHGVVRPNLDLDLNRMDDSEESGPPFSVDLQTAVEGVGSSVRSSNSTTQPPRRVMDFDLNDGPSFEEVGVEEPAFQPMLVRKVPPSSSAGPPPIALAGLRMGGETMTLSPWFSGPNNSFSGVPLPSFPSGRAPESGYSVAAATAAHSFLNAANPTQTGSHFTGEMFRASPAPSPSPAIVYPPAERMTFGGSYGPIPVFGNSPGFLPSSAPYTLTTSMPYGDASGQLPYQANSSQLASAATMTSSYVRPSYFMGMSEMGPTDNNGATWSRPSLDLNAGPDHTDNDSGREEGMHGRLPPLHPVGSAFPGLPPPVKRKEPEGGWNFYSGAGTYKQAAWR